MYDSKIGINVKPAIDYLYNHNQAPTRHPKAGFYKIFINETR